MENEPIVTFSDIQQCLDLLIKIKYSLSLEDMNTKPFDDCIYILAETLDECEKMISPGQKLLKFTEKIIKERIQ